MGITVKKAIDMEPSVQKVRQAVVLFVSDYYRRSVNTRVPSLREICRDEKVVKACGGTCYPKKLEPVFPLESDGSGPLMKRVCLPYDVPHLELEEKTNPLYAYPGMCRDHRRF